MNCTTSMSFIHCISDGKLELVAGFNADVNLSRRADVVVRADAKAVPRVQELQHAHAPVATTCPGTTARTRTCCKHVYRNYDTHTHLLQAIITSNCMTSFLAVSPQVLVTTAHLFVVEFVLTWDVPQQQARISFNHRTTHCKSSKRH